MPASILIVEDNAMNLELMAFLLQSYGHKVSRATDGEAGVAAALAGKFDLILADILMPKLDGYDFVKTVKMELKLTSMPIVAVTALAMVGDRERVLTAGFDGYIAKPINPETFVHEVDRYLVPALRSAPRGEPRTVASPERTPVAKSGKVILVVDDVETNVAVVRAALESAGHLIEESNSAEEAMRVATMRPPDLILADIQMPDASGFDLLRAIKSNDRLRSVPFIFLSATYWHDEDRMRALELGAAKFLVRPIDPQTLLAEVADTLEKFANG